MDRATELVSRWHLDRRPSEKERQDSAGWRRQLQRWFASRSEIRRMDWIIDALILPRLEVPRVPDRPSGEGEIDRDVFVIAVDGTRGVSSDPPW